MCAYISIDSVLFRHLNYLFSFTMYRSLAYHGEETWMRRYVCCFIFFLYLVTCQCCFITFLLILFIFFETVAINCQPPTESRHTQMKEFLCAKIKKKRWVEVVSATLLLLKTGKKNIHRWTVPTLLTDLILKSTTCLGEIFIGEVRSAWSNVEVEVRGISFQCQRMSVLLYQISFSQLLFFYFLFSCC